MRKFFAAAIVVLAALFLLPVLLVRNEPLVGVGAAEIPEGAEKVGGRASFEANRSKPQSDFSHAADAAANVASGADAAAGASPSAEPSHTKATLAPVTSVPNEPPVGTDEPDDSEQEDDESPTPPPGAVAVSAELEGIGDAESKAGEDIAATICVVGEGEMALEDYVAGVVAAEMGPSFPTEARRAQAVAARSLALYRVNHPKHGGSAVCLDASCCMAWKTPDEGALDAAQSTEGVVATYDGEPIMAAFFSGSDGATLSAAEVWGGGVPYLVSVASPWEGGGSIRGHGVGMSQYGAAGMADDGAGYDEILRHYYTGIEVG